MEFINLVVYVKNVDKTIDIHCNLNFENELILKEIIKRYNQTLINHFGAKLFSDSILFQEVNTNVYKNYNNLVTVDEINMVDSVYDNTFTTVDFYNFSSFDQYMKNLVIGEIVGV